MRRRSDLTFIRMWPREVFQHMSGKALAIKSHDTLKRPGVYILYRADEPYYVGQAAVLFQRLHDHARKMTDRYYPHWDYFSCFAFKKYSKKTQQRLDEIEGILIAALPRAVNSSTPRWHKDKIPKAIRNSMKAQAQKAMVARAGN